MSQHSPKKLTSFHFKQYFKLKIFKDVKNTSYVVMLTKEIKWNLKWNLFIYFGSAGYRLQGLVHAGKCRTSVLKPLASGSF